MIITVVYGENLFWLQGNLLLQQHSLPPQQTGCTADCITHSWLQHPASGIAYLCLLSLCVCSLCPLVRQSGRERDAEKVTCLWSVVIVYFQSLRLWCIFLLHTKCVHLSERAALHDLHDCFAVNVDMFVFPLF